MNRTPIVIMLIVSTIVAAGFWGYLLNTVKAKESNVARSLSEFNAAQDDNARLLSMSNLAEDVKSNMASLDLAFVKRDEVATFISNLEHLANKSRVKISISEFTVEDSIPSRVVGKLHVRTDIEGTESAVHQFTSDIESSEPILIINKIIFTRFEDSKKMSLWKATLDINGYVID